MTQRLSALASVCELIAAYFFANYFFRWAAYDFSAGGGAYGWSAPSRALWLGMVFASVASIWLGFVGVPLLLAAIVSRVAPHRPLPAKTLYAVLIGMTVYAELDADWYALAKQHIQWADLKGVFGLQWSRHLGLEGRDIWAAVLPSLLHIVLLTAIVVTASTLLSSKRNAVKTFAMRVRLPLVALGLTVGAAISHARSDQWHALVSRNLYDISPSRLMQGSHPDEALLTTLFRADVAAAAAGQAKSADVGDEAVTPALPHILVIWIEGWNARFFDPTIMPKIWAYSRAGLRFHQHFSTGNNTLFGIIGTLHGKSPAFFFNGPRGPVPNPAVDHLKAAGYAVKRFGGSLTSYPSITGYLASIERGDPDEDSPASSSLERVRAALSKPGKAVLFLYYRDSHFPYRHAAGYKAFGPEIEETKVMRGSIPAEQQQQVVNRYKNVLRETDDRIAALLSTVDLQHTAVIITGDHGEAMYETGRLSHSSALERAQTLTPLLLLAPGLAPADVDAVSSHVDILPTVLTLAGLPRDPALDGTPLTSPRGGGYALVVQNSQNDRPGRLAVASAHWQLVFDISQMRAPRPIDLVAPNEGPLRVRDTDATALHDGMRFFAGLLAKSGCLPGTAAMPRPAARGNCRD